MIPRVSPSSPEPGDISFEVVDPSSDMAVTALTSYFDELERRFVGGFERGDAIEADAPHMRPPEGLFVVARAGGRTAACGAVLTLSPGLAEIKRMWVDPSFQ